MQSRIASSNRRFTAAKTVLSSGRGRGRRLFFSLLSLPEDTEDLSEIIDKARSFLIEIEQYADGLQLFREAASKFPEVAEFQEGIGCCAGHKGFIDEALAAGRRAI